MTEDLKNLQDRTPKDFVQRVRYVGCRGNEMSGPAMSDRQNAKVTGALESRRGKKEMRAANRRRAVATDKVS